MLEFWLISAASDLHRLACQSGVWKRAQGSGLNSGQVGTYCQGNTYCGRASGAGECYGSITTTGYHGGTNYTVTWNGSNYVNAFGSVVCNLGVFWFN